MSKTFKRAAMSTICMLIVAVMSLTGATYAWFSASTTAEITGMTMEVAAADGGLQVRKTASDAWTSTVNFGAKKSGLKPVSTVDAEKFYLGTVNPADEDQIKTVADEANIWSETFQAKNTGYGEIVVSLANTTEAPIFVDTDATDIKNSANAARMAIFTKNSTASAWTLAYIYSAGETYQGIKDASGDTYFNFRANNDAPEGTSKDIDSTRVGDVTKLTPAQADCKFTLPGLDAQGNETIVDIKIVVWVEGQDAQCVNQNAGCAFNVDLDLVAALATQNG